MQKEFILQNFKDLQKAASLLAGSVKKYKMFSGLILKDLSRAGDYISKL